MKKEPTSYNFWLYKEAKKQINADLYPAPVCKDAEHRFITFLAILHSLSNKKPNIITTKVASYDEKRTITSSLLQKINIYSTNPHNNYTYYLGSPIYLALTDKIAGTICSFAPHLVSKKQPQPIQAIRPFHNHGFINERISYEIKNSPRVCPVYYKDQIKILEKTKIVITKLGLLPALFYYLDKLELPHDRQQMLYNSKQHAK